MNGGKKKEQKPLYLLGKRGYAIYQGEGERELRVIKEKKKGGDLGTTPSPAGKAKPYGKLWERRKWFALPKKGGGK